MDSLDRLSVAFAKRRLSPIGDNLYRSLDVLRAHHNPKAVSRTG